MFKFEASVRLLSDASASEILARLAKITAPPRSFNRMQREKPLRGRLTEEGGFLRWPLNQYGIASPRNLKFRITETSNGSILEGKFSYGHLCASSFWVGLPFLFSYGSAS